MNKSLTNIRSRNIGKKIFVLISFIILVVVIISGYNILVGVNSNNDKITIEEKKVEIINYKVITKWFTGCKCDNTYEEHVKPGFYYTGYIGDGAYYNLTGEILNNVGKKIDNIIINAKFYDKNNTELFDTIQLNSSVIISNLSKGESEKFSMDIRPVDYYYLHKDENPHENEKVEELYNIFYSVKTFEFDVSFN